MITQLGSSCRPTDAADTKDLVSDRSFRDNYANLYKSISDLTSSGSGTVHFRVYCRVRRRMNVSDLTLRQQKVAEGLDATETTIRLDPSNYHKFVEALEKDTPLKIQHRVWHILGPHVVRAKVCV